MFEITKEFRFEAAHTLRRAIATSQRIHGHSYRATVTLRGEADASGMVMDFAALGCHLDRVRALLDHQFLDDVAGLGPATLEALAVFIWDMVARDCPNLVLVRVFRDSEGESCCYQGMKKSSFL